MAVFTFTNYSNLFFDNSAVASTTISVLGLTGHAVTDVSVTLTGLSHTWMADLDILLVAPNSASNLMILSDLGGSNDLVNSTLTLTDSATAAIGDVGQVYPVPSGTYRPNSFDPNETDGQFGTTTYGFNHATADGSVSFASAFGGIDAFGTWSLYFQDDASGDNGYLESWSLTVSTDSDIVALGGLNTGDTITVAATGAQSGSWWVNSGDEVFFSGVTGFQLFGNGGNDVLIGGGGNDLLVGGSDRDRVFGGNGNDTLVVAEFDQAVGEVLDGGAGTDLLRLGSIDSAVFDLRRVTLRSIEQIAYSAEMAVGVREILLNAAQIGPGLSATGSITATAAAAVSDFLRIDMQTVQTFSLAGLTLVNFDQATDQVDIIGDADAESITGGATNDRLVGNAGNDLLLGAAGNDTLVGGDGDDTMDGGIGNDLMIAGNGSDTYRFRFANGGQDTVSEMVGGGTGTDTLDILDRTAAQLDYRLDGDDLVVTQEGSANSISIRFHFSGGPGFAAEVLRTTDGQRTIADTGVGTSADELLVGFLANNGGIIDGAGGDDIISAWTNDDTLIGGAGNDQLRGGLGNDTYRFTFATSDEDRITERLGGGTDTLQITDAAAAELGYRRSGNLLVIERAGTAARVVIEDHFSGVPTNRVEQIQATDGLRFLKSVLVGTATSDILVGASGSETLNGGGGADIIAGGGAKDVLTGGLGADVFTFTAVSDSTAAAAGRDTITDFSQPQGDRINLRLIDANTGLAGDQAFSFLGLGPTTGAGTLAFTHTGGNTLVQADVNGGGADFSVLLAGIHNLLVSDFLL